MKITNQVAAIIADVKARGDKAVEYYTFKFDNVIIKSKNFKVSAERINKACKNINPEVKEAIDKAAGNVELFHKFEFKMLPKTWTVKQKGVKLGQVYSPIEKIGIYIPGGMFPYFSTVLMSAIPARVAGVKRIIMTTPPKNITDEMLYAASICGIKDVFAIGGPQAVSAMALGTKTVPKVDLICGPGNIYVNEAKRQLFGEVGIDSLAGPSEVVILADNSARPAYIIFDLLAQAEHDSYAKAYLFTDSSGLLKKVKSSLPKHSIQSIKLIKTSMSKAIGQINAIAPEHLEIAVKNPDAVIKKIKNAGAIFAGCYTPTAVGDYWAGPSHVLPTGGSAKFSSGLSVLTFLKRTSYINYSKEKIQKDAKFITRLAEAEGLVNHSSSVLVRR